MKDYESGRQLNEKILAGASKLADAVGATLGPRGRNVILKEKGKRPIITKDGVTVAKFVEALATGPQRLLCLHTQFFKRHNPI